MRLFAEETVDVEAQVEDYMGAFVVQVACEEAMVTTNDVGGGVAAARCKPSIAHPRADRPDFLQHRFHEIGHKRMAFCGCYFLQAFR